MLQRREQNTLTSERPMHMDIQSRAFRVSLPSLTLLQFSYSLFSRVLVLPLTHRLQFLFLTGVHSNFSTTIPPTSWQADLPPHHPSSACSDGTLKLNTAASTEGTGVAGKENECLAWEPVLPCQLSHPSSHHALSLILQLSVPSALFSFRTLWFEQPFLRMPIFFYR